MADTTTANYGWVKPEVGGSNDTWGTKLNGNWDDADTEVKANADAAAAAQSSADAAQSTADTKLTEGTGGAQGRTNDQNDARFGRIPAGTRMMFAQASAPTGWTQDTSINDRVLRVVSGSGGGTGGSWAISGISVLGHALTEAEMPSHDHGNGSLSADTSGSHNHGNNTGSAGGHNHDLKAGEGTNVAPISSQRYVSLNDGNQASLDNTTGLVQSAGAHTHHIPTDGNHGHSISGSTANAGSDNPHDHGASHDGNWRPSYTDVIVATKD